MDKMLSNVGFEYCCKIWCNVRNFIILILDKEKILSSKGSPTKL